MNNTAENEPSFGLLSNLNMRFGRARARMGEEKRGESEDLKIDCFAVTSFHMQLSILSDSSQVSVQLQHEAKHILVTPVAFQRLAKEEASGNEARPSPSAASDNLQN